MLSRFALNSSFRKFVLTNKYQIASIQKCKQSTSVETTNEVEADIVKQEWEKYPMDEIGRPYPYPPINVEEAYSKFEEIKKDDESVEDMLRVWFGRDMPTINDDKNPQRDLVNFPTFVRPIDPPKTRILNLVPEEYFQFFYKKTGVTGPFVFGAGLLTFLLSKELLILEHEFAVGVSLFIWICIGLNKLGPKVSKQLEEKIIQEDKGWLQFQQGSIKALQEYIAKNKHNQEAIKNQSILFNAKRENVHLQREAEYRKRLQQLYEHTKKKLDYQIAQQDTQKSFAQKHMVNWVIDSVMNSITPEQEKLALTNSISELKNLSSRKAGVI